MIELCIGPKKVANAAKPWTTSDLDILARMILENDAYPKIATILGRSVSAVKSMIDGRSGRKSYVYLQQVTAKLIEENKKLADAKKVPLTFQNLRLLS